MEKLKRKKKDYQQKLQVRVASRIAEQFRTYDLRKWGTSKAAYLSFHWFNDSWNSGFELVTRRFELVIREFELVTRGFELVLLRFNS